MNEKTGRVKSLWHIACSHLCPAKIYWESGRQAWDLSVHSLKDATRYPLFLCPIKPEQWYCAPQWFVTFFLNDKRGFRCLTALYLPPLSLSLFLHRLMNHFCLVMGNNCLCKTSFSAYVSSSPIAKMTNSAIDDL